MILNSVSFSWKKKKLKSFMEVDILFAHLFVFISLKAIDAGRAKIFNKIIYHNIIIRDAYHDKLIRDAYPYIILKDTLQ